MEKPILLVDFGRLMDDQLHNRLNINKKTFVLDDYVVDAIPIDWILKWACEFIDPNSEGYKMAMELVHDWRKENEEGN